MSKFYAVKKGYQVGIFTDWDSCKKSVNGFSGAVYKSFKTLPEAKSFIDPDVHTMISCSDTLSVPSVTPQHSYSLGDCNTSDNIIVYTDGSCCDNVGGYGCVIIDNVSKTMTKCYGRVPYTPCTNNIAELYAVLSALESTQGKITIYTDSKYTIGCLTQWINSWMNNGWKTSTGNLVQNKELIQQIYDLMRSRHVTFNHVYGHTGNTFNELADKLAEYGRIRSDTKTTHVEKLN